MPEGIELARGVTAGAGDLTEAPRNAGAALLRSLWLSPWPATLEDLDFCYVAVNDAFAAMTGRAREQLIGADPIDLAPAEDRSIALSWRRQNKARLLDPEPLATSACRLVDAAGRERWYRALRVPVLDAGGRTLLLALLHDCTDEYRARAAAIRAERERDEWAASCPFGIVAFDADGRVERSNAAFDALAGKPAAALDDAPAALRRLLACDDGCFDEALQPGAAGIVREALVTGADGRSRRLRSHVHGLRSAAAPRFIAWIEDASADAQLDLARVQVRALVDATGAALATLHPSLGWVHGDAPVAASADASPGAAALSAIGRDAVAPESLQQFEALQHALRDGRRAQVRYAISHADVGTRWLLSSVEPGDLPSGGRATSVVTQDITAREDERLQAEQRIRELCAIVEGAGIGIAWLRGDALLSCNACFARLLGVGEGGSLSDLQELPDDIRSLLAEGMAALAGAASYEAELRLDGPLQGSSRRCRLSLRRLNDGAAVPAAAAVLEVITKT